MPLSFEVFPPHTDAQRTLLDDVVDRLAPVAVDGFSVTMGAGGATRKGTRETALSIAKRCGRPVTAHLTTLCMRKEETLSFSDRLWSSGINRILALKGDPPKDMIEVPSGFGHANDLVKALANQHPFEIAVAGYPEKHPEAHDLDSDIARLREKIDAGATMVYCQFVLEPSAYGRFLEKCEKSMGSRCRSYRG